MEPVALTPLAPIANRESFIERFGDWIEGLFHKSEDIYNALTDAEKKAAVWASGLISVANTYINAVPTVLWSVIQAKFPDLSENIVHGFIDKLRERVDNLQNEIPLTMTDALTWLQNYLRQYHSDHSLLNAISTNAYNILSIMLSPTTAFEKLISIGVYVYHLIVRPHVQAPLPADVAITETPTLPQATPPASDNTTPPQTGTTPTANTPDKDPVNQGDLNPPATDADMQISNEAAANLAGESAPDQPEGVPVEESPVSEPGVPVEAISDYHKKNAGEGFDIAPPAAETETPVQATLVDAPAQPETIDEQPTPPVVDTTSPEFKDAVAQAVKEELANRDQNPNP